MEYLEIIEELKQFNKSFNSDYIKLVNYIVEFIRENKQCKIIGLGAGRMGYSLRAFIMRLSHLGFDAYMIGDTNVPKCDKNTLVIINSSSGETESIKLFASQAKQYNAKTILFTSKQKSSIGNLVNIQFVYGENKSKQLMKSVYEQFTLLMFDKLVFDIKEILQIETRFIENNHSILE